MAMRILALALTVGAVAALSVVPAPVPIYSIPLGDANSSTAAWGTTLPLLTVPAGVVLMYAHPDPSTDGLLLDPTVVLVDTGARAVAWSWALPAASGPYYRWSCFFVASSDGAAVYAVCNSGVWRVLLATGTVAWARTDIKVWAPQQKQTFTLPSLLAGLMVTWAVQPPEDSCFPGQLSLLSEDTGASRWTRDLGLICYTFSDPTRSRLLAFSFTNASSANITAYDTATGSPVWSTPSPNPQLSGSYPLISAERAAIVYSNQTYSELDVLDVASGTLLYSTLLPENSDGNDAYIFGELSIAINSDDGDKVSVISAVTGVVRWEFPSRGWGTFANATLVAVATPCNPSNCSASGGVIFGLSADTGVVAWTSQVPAPGLANLFPFYDDSSLFVAPAGGLFATGFTVPYPPEAQQTLLMSFDGAGALVSQLEMTGGFDASWNPDPLCTSADGSVLFYHQVDPVTFASSFVAATLPGHAASDAPTFSPAIGASRGMSSTPEARAMGGRRTRAY